MRRSLGAVGSTGVLAATALLTGLAVTPALAADTTVSPAASSSAVVTFSGGSPVTVPLTLSANYHFAFTGRNVFPGYPNGVAGTWSETGKKILMQAANKGYYYKFMITQSDKNLGSATHPGSIKIVVPGGGGTWYATRS